MLKIKPVDLKCEGAVQPVGIDVRIPKLSWRTDSSLHIMQTGYQILVADEEEILNGNIGNIWDSGFLQSSDSIHILYNGRELESYKRYFWKVRISDQTDGISEYSEVSFWEMGILDRNLWQALWIGLDKEYTIKTADTPDNAGNPPPYLRKIFNIDKKVLKARLYVTSHGINEIYLNNKKVGADLFSPGWTDYPKRLQYNTYDITQMLTSGENVVGAALADGWYCGQISIFGRNHYGDYPLKLLMKLKIDFYDNTSCVIFTDNTWKGKTGPLIFSDFLVGELYDARLELKGWNEKNYDDSDWNYVNVFDISKENLVAQVDPPARVTGIIKPVSRHEPAPGVFVFDIGQNISGRLSVRINGKLSEKINLRHAEVLNKDGTLFTKNLRTALSTDTYICKGEEIEVYEPTFTFHGFRYIELTGYNGIPEIDIITAKIINSDLEVTGCFESSSQLLNKLFSNIIWSHRGNFLSVPTDCPQRDERMGWMGDGQIFSKTACFNMDCELFYTKWIYDMQDAQTNDGMFTDISPNIKNMTEMNILGNAAWGDAGIIVPWNLYMFYGDKRILEYHYEYMIKWIDYLEKTSDNYIRLLNNHWGDWLNIDAVTPKEVMSTAYFAYSVALTLKISKVLDKQLDVQRLNSLFIKIKDAFIHEFVDENGIVKGDTQTCYLLALMFDLLPQSVKDKSIERLIYKIEERDYHLSTGFIGVGYLLPVLADTGHIDIAYRILNNDTFPSWGYEIKHGATTIWEHWDSYSEEFGYESPGTYLSPDFYMNSFNHYAKGSVGEFLYRYIGVINFDYKAPAFKHIIIKPMPGGGLKHADVTHKSPYGTIKSSWKIENDVIKLKIVIPFNSTATIHIPGINDSVDVEAGEYEFTGKV